MKLIVLDGYALNPGDLSWDCLKPFGEVTVYPRTPENEAAQRIGDGEIVLTNKTPITARLLDACPNIRLICVLATGYNVVDCAAARARGIPVCNVPAYSTAAVAQFTFALLLELCHRVGDHDRAVHSGQWSACPDFCFWNAPLIELAGKTIGIIGFGRIGQAVAKIASAMGMEVLAYSRTQRQSAENLARYVDLQTLLSQSDVISLHCPLTVENAGMINRETIALMKDGVMLLNTARGPLLCEQDVADALASGKICGAAMDVVSAEPISPNNPLLTVPNCILTPHIAWAPKAARQRLLDCTVSSIRSFLEGTPINTVN
ncbi:MAG: D-2-hydroxyacid dehydrogenase [Oscillospiraceae bacterium]|nr:D-2-hydroxyacid dehydrogenase [Oscillospiraceae bacterium]